MKEAFEKIIDELKQESIIVDDDAGHRAVEIIHQIAEEYNNGWISCSDRLPEECIEVLVSVKEIDDSFYTRTCWVQDGVWVIKKTPLQPTVIAWQPLPEPFKERD